MDPEIVNGATKALDSETSKILVSRLWPTMLFLIVMSFITMAGIRIFNEKYSVSMYIGFWVWLLTQTVVTAFGLHGLFTDVRILNASDRVK